MMQELHNKELFYCSTCNMCYTTFAKAYKCCKKPKLKYVHVNKIPIKHYLNPSKNTESLYCDTKFLEKLLDKQIKRRKM